MVHQHCSNFRIITPIFSGYLAQLRNGSRKNYLFFFISQFVCVEVLQPSQLITKLRSCPAGQPNLSTLVPEQASKAVNQY